MSFPLSTMKRRDRRRVRPLVVAAVMMLACMASLVGLPSHARSVAALPDAAIAARVDGKPITTLSLDTMTWLARNQDPAASRAKVLDTLIGNRLLAGAARHLFRPPALHPPTRVAFDSEVALDDRLVATLRARYGQSIEAALQALPGGTLQGVIIKMPPLAPLALERVLGHANQLQLAYVFTPEQIAQAKRTTLLEYRFGDRSGGISLYDVYRRQNVQGRVELFNRNTDFILQQAKLRLASLFILDWANQQFGATAVNDLRQTLADQADVQALLELHGIGNDTDAHSAILSQLAKQVSSREIAAYYQTHKDEFKRIERVKARHIRVNDEALANQIVSAARNADFGALAQRYSRADDAQSGGDLGWIVHRDGLSWLETLAYAQPTGEVSHPIRMPAGPTDPSVWEIVLVEQRTERYQRPGSEAVRYIASNAIARGKAAKRIATLRAQTWRNARIDINRKVQEAS